MFSIENFDIIKKAKDNIFFFDIFCLISTILIFLVWSLNKEFGFYLVLLMLSGTLIIFNQIKMTLPFILYITMTVSSSFTYVPILISLIIFTVITLLTYFVLNKPKIKLGKHGIFLLLIGISMLVPILWYEPIETLSSGNVAFYFLGIVCFLVYLLIKVSKDSILPYVIKTFSYVPLLLMLELVWHYFTAEEVGSHVLIKLGWGGGNHSSMMIVLAFPFIVYRIYKEKNIIIPVCLAIASCIALPFTFSRGGLLVFFIQLVFLIIFSLYYFRKIPFLSKIYEMIWKLKYVILPLIIISCAIAVTVFWNLDNRDQILDKIFSPNGRLEIYEQGINLFTENVRNFLFGRGLINDYLYPTRFLFYHNTIIQVMVTGGLIMVCIMAVHAFHKYVPLLMNLNSFTVCVFISFITVEMYGMIDSTYFTNYYMIALVIILACFEIDKELIFKREEISYDYIE